MRVTRGLDSPKSRKRGRSRPVYHSGWRSVATASGAKNTARRYFGVDTALCRTDEAVLLSVLSFSGSPAGRPARESSRRSLAASAPSDTALPYMLCRASVEPAACEGVLAPSEAHGRRRAAAPSAVRRGAAPRSRRSLTDDTDGRRRGGSWSSAPLDSDRALPRPRPRSSLRALRPACPRSGKRPLFPRRRSGLRRSRCVGMGFDDRSVQRSFTPIEATGPVGFRLKDLKDLQPGSILLPPQQAVVAGRIRTVPLGQIAPRRSGALDPQDPVDHSPMIYPRTAPSVIPRQMIF